MNIKKAHIDSINLMSEGFAPADLFGQSAGVIRTVLK